MKRTLILALGLALCLGAGEAFAAKALVVNSTDTDHDGTCEPLASGDCTLPEAIDAANGGGAKTITFDPNVFAPGAGVEIQPTAPFPVITRGITIDGRGAGVVLDGTSAPANSRGLQFASGVGNALSGAAVRNLTIQGWSGGGLHVCGGAVDDCQDPLSKVSIENVKILDSGSGVDTWGIRILGMPVKSVTVERVGILGAGDIALQVRSHSDLAGVGILASSVVDSAGHGIIVRADGKGSKWKLIGNAVKASGDGHGIEVSTSQGGSSIVVSENDLVENGGAGIQLAGGDGFSKVTLKDNTCVKNDEEGIHLSNGGRYQKVKVESNHLSANGYDAMQLSSGGGHAKIKIAGNLFSGSPSDDGLTVSGGGSISGVQVIGNTAIGNDDDGFDLSGLPTKSKIEKNRASGNGDHGFEFAATRTKVKGNVAEGNEGDGFRIQGGSDQLAVSGNRALANGEVGVGGLGFHVESGVSGSKFQKNTMLGNVTGDAFDNNAACGTNTWKKNTFLQVNPGCIQ